MELGIKQVSSAALWELYTFLSFGHGGLEEAREGGSLEALFAEQRPHGGGSYGRGLRWARGQRGGTLGRHSKVY